MARVAPLTADERAQWQAFLEQYPEFRQWNSVVDLGNLIRQAGPEAAQQFGALMQRFGFAEGGAREGYRITPDGGIVQQGSFKKFLLTGAAIVGGAAVAGSVLGAAAGASSGASASGSLTAGPLVGGVTSTVPGAAATSGVASGSVLGSVGGFLSGGGGVLGAVLTGLGIAGTALSVLGTLKAGSQAKELAEFNAKVAERQAADALALGADEESRFRQGVRTLIGSQRAGFASQNVDVGVGSPVDVTADAAFLGELDALAIRKSAQIAAQDKRDEAQNYRLGGAQQQTASRYQAAGSILGAGTSLLAARYGWGA